MCVDSTKTRPERTIFGPMVYHLSVYALGWPAECVTISTRLRFISLLNRWWADTSSNSVYSLCLCCVLSRICVSGGAFFTPRVALNALGALMLFMMPTFYLSCVSVWCVCFGKPQLIAYNMVVVCTFQTRLCLWCSNGLKPLWSILFIIVYCVMIVNHNDVKTADRKCTLLPFSNYLIDFDCDGGVENVCRKNHSPTWTGEKWGDSLISTNRVQGPTTSEWQRSGTLLFMWLCIGVFQPRLSGCAWHIWSLCRGSHHRHHRTCSKQISAWLADDRDLWAVPCDI